MTAMTPTDFRLTYEEISALSRLSSEETPAYLPASADLPEDAVASGLRSLVGRGLLRAVDGDIVLAGVAHAAIRVLGRQHPSLVLMAFAAGDSPQGVRLLPWDGSEWLLESTVMTGVVSLQPVSGRNAETLVRALVGPIPDPDGDRADRLWPGVQADPDVWIGARVVQIAEIPGNGAEVDAATWLIDDAGLWRVHHDGHGVGGPGRAEAASSQDVNTAVSQAMGRLDLQRNA
jgi:hypothetical protein